MNFHHIYKKLEGIRYTKYFMWKGSYNPIQYKQYLRTSRRFSRVWESPSSFFPLLQIRVSSKQTKKIRFEPKQTETRSVSIVFGFVSWKQKLKISFCFGVSNLYQNNWNKKKCFKTNRNNPKFSEKIPKYTLCQLFRLSSVCFGSIKTWNSLFW